MSNLTLSRIQDISQAVPTLHAKFERFLTCLTELPAAEHVKQTTLAAVNEITQCADETLSGTDLHKFNGYLLLYVANDLSGKINDTSLLIDLYHLALNQLYHLLTADNNVDLMAQCFLSLCQLHFNTNDRVAAFQDLKLAYTCLQAIEGRQQDRTLTCFIESATNLILDANVQRYVLIMIAEVKKLRYELEPSEELKAELRAARVAADVAAVFAGEEPVFFKRATTELEPLQRVEVAL